VLPRYLTPDQVDFAYENDLFMDVEAGCVGFTEIKNVALTTLKPKRQAWLGENGGPGSQYAQKCADNALRLKNLKALKLQKNNPLAF
jgi:hypothetical protein